MKIGFYMKWPKGSLQWSGNVIGDELYGESMCKSLRTLPTVKSAELYAPNYLPDQSLDVLIYLNDNEPLRDKAKKHVLYLQNAYGEGADVKLKQMYTFGYDGYAFMSYKLLEIHTKRKKKSLMP